MFINDVGQNAVGGDQRRHRGRQLRLARHRGAHDEPRPPRPGLRLWPRQHGDHRAARSPAAPSTTRPRSSSPLRTSGDYFFADFCGGWIRRFDPATGTASGFATGIPSPVDLQVAPDGSLYYLARGTGSVWKVESTAEPGAGDHVPSREP